MSATLQHQEPLWLLGAGGHGKVVLSMLCLRGVPVAGILDDEPSFWGKKLSGFQIVGPVDFLQTLEDPLAIVAVGENAIRRKIVQAYPKNRWFSATHPAACIDPSVALGEGTVVFAGAVLQAESKLGNHVIVNTGATVDHDCRVEDFAHLCPGVHLAGQVHIGQGCLLGTGAAVIPGKTVGNWTIVGAGAAVVSHLPPDITAVGVPARIIKSHGMESA